jgi:hypothetical protein
VLFLFLTCYYKAVFCGAFSVRVGHYFSLKKSSSFLKGSRRGAGFMRGGGG